eukprot:Lankesteria_metandrocarpae@DN1937_c0_g1_i2.p1
MSQGRSLDAAVIILQLLREVLEGANDTTSVGDVSCCPIKENDETQCCPLSTTTQWHEVQTLCTQLCAKAAFHRPTSLAVAVNGNVPVRAMDVPVPIVHFASSSVPVTLDVGTEGTLLVAGSGSSSSSSSSSSVVCELERAAAVDHKKNLTMMPDKEALRDECVLMH